MTEWWPKWPKHYLQSTTQQIQNIQNVIPFVAITTEDDICIQHNHSWQIPLEPAFASTTHEMQGTTSKFGAVIDPSEKKTFARGLDYVAASRPTELANLTLFAPLTVPMPV